MGLVLSLNRIFTMSEPLTNSPRDWSPTQYGPWLRFTPAYRDVYGVLDRRAWKLRGRLVEYWYYWKCRLWKRYNVVRVRTLPPTWMDADERMLHVNFAILGDVIEKEQIFEHVGTDGDDPTDGKSWAWALSEIRDLWQWWTVDRAKQRKEEDDALTAWHDAMEAAGGVTWTPCADNANLSQMHMARTEETERLAERHRELETRNDLEDERNLIRLMRVRKYLWT